MSASLLLLLLAAPAPSFFDAARERRLSVNSFDRIRIDGPFKVKLMTGVSPFATLRGSSAAIDRIYLDVHGRTLVIRSNPSSWGGGYPGQEIGPVDIAIGTPGLSAVWVNGSGTLAIDKIEGLSFDVSIQGSGSAAIGQASVDQLRVGISGAGSATIAGSAPRLTAILRGTSTLDATGLSVKDATIGAEGPSVVKLTATNSVKVDARGTATVELAGAPACTVTAKGSATVIGCR